MDRKEFLRLVAAGCGASVAAVACGGGQHPVASADPVAPPTPPKSPPAAPTGDAAMVDQLTAKMLERTRGMFELIGMYMGDRLGLYAALAKAPYQTSTELAAATRTNERYIREWLEAQTVAGIVEVQDEKADAKARRFRLPKPHVEVLVDEDNINYLAPLARLAVSTTVPLPLLLDAYRTGKGVSWAAYGPDAREGQGALNRTTFIHQLGKEWLPAIPEVDKRLKASPAARVLDVGCGLGWSSIAMAKAYPQIRVDGFDIDAPSIELAKAHAKAAGVADRVSFSVRSAYDPQLTGSYELVTAFEMLHDLSQPVAALKAMRHLAGTKGSVLIVDERVGDAFSAKADEVERLMYGWSTLMCLPNGKDDKTSAETGTVMRAGTLRGYATEAGFKKVAILPIDNFFFRFYLLAP